MFRQRLISWAILWIGVIWMLFSAPLWIAWLALTFAGVWAQGEFYFAQHAKGLHVHKSLGLLFGFLWFLGYGLFLIFGALPQLNLALYHQIIASLFLISLLSWKVLDRITSETPISELAHTVLGFFYVPFLFGFVAEIAFAKTDLFDPHAMVVYLFAITKFTDVGAYVVGKMIGKNKMIPHVSPGKTWEGFFGGIIISLLLSLAFAYSMGGLTILRGMHAVILGLILPLASVIGDLAESVVKRDAHIKDSGHSVPGIGGALDLIDSLLFTAPLLYFYLKLVVGLP